MRIAPIDWVILAVGFAFFLAWAIYLNRKVRTTADFLVSGRKVRMWLGLSAGIAGEIGLFAIASLCEQGFTHGFSFVAVNLISISITIPLFGIFGFGIQRFRATKAVSVPEYLEMRYDRKIRIAVGMFNCLAGVLQLCAIPIASAHFVRVLVQAPDHALIAGLSVPTDWIIMTLFLVCPLIFTFLGGYVTLIVIDFFQAILIITVLTVVLLLMVQTQGAQSYWSGLEKSLGSAGLNPFSSSGNAYGLRWFLWLNVMTILLQFSFGPYLQKYAAMDKPRTVSLSYLLGQVLGVNKALIVIGLGVGALAALGATSTGETAGIAAQDWNKAATPYYMASLVPPVLFGFLLLGLLFADIAVTEQYILSWSTSIVNDCILPFRKSNEPLSSKQHIRLVRLTILVLCVVFFLYGLTYTPTTTLWDYMWTLSTIIGGSGIVVMLGMYWRRASSAGAWCALLVCWIVPLVDIVSRQVMARIDPTKVFPWEPSTTGFFTYLTAFALMVIVSLLSSGPTKFWDLGKAVREQNRAEAA
jgi:SSS family solute:Na+ symporter